MKTDLLQSSPFKNKCELLTKLRHPTTHNKKQSGSYNGELFLSSTSLDSLITKYVFFVWYGLARLKVAQHTPPLQLQNKCVIELNVDHAAHHIY